MATEEQTTNNDEYALTNFIGTRAGQRLTISNRIVTKLRFYLRRVGTPGGTTTFTIRKVSNDAVLATKLQGNSNDISTSLTWYEVTLDSAVLVNEEVRISVEVSAGAAGNYIGVRTQTTNVKASEVASVYLSSWTDQTVNPDDCAYVYTYDGGAASPTVTTQAVTVIAATTATGNGNVTALGEPTATQHGHVWATHTINPLIAYTSQDNYVENGAPSATGAYTSSLTGLTTNTLYYVRSFVKNTVGTFYGAEVTFTSGAASPSITTNQPLSVVVTTCLGYGTINSTGGSAITAHGMCWDLAANPDPDTSDSTTDEGTGALGDFYTAVTGLTANTAYKMRAYATNTSGTSYGAVVNFTTLASGTPIVTTEPCSNDQGISATGHGTIVDIGAAAVTAHGHCWATTVNPTISGSNVDNGAGSATAFTSDITGLTAGTTYYVRAYATNTYGTAYGDNVTLDRSVGGEARRIISIGTNKRLFFTDDDGTDCVLVGTPV